MSLQSSQYATTLSEDPVSSTTNLKPALAIKNAETEL